jgi:8-oxo-dGTP pyrophosphatase MutT (NUDIX family)
MERTRHFTATVYIVNEGATALHDHRHLGIELPPGGHVDRGELPHEAGLREVREETGLDPTLLAETADFASETCRPIPRPRHLLLADVNRYDGVVGHQHIDHVYFATVPGRAIDPDDDEEPADAWAWYTADELRASDLDEDVVALGTEAIEVAERRES